MKVHELVSLLQKQDQDIEVGVFMSSLSGWVQGIDGLVVSDDGVICVDQG
jgi:hypothetical protein